MTDALRLSAPCDISMTPAQREAFAPFLAPHRREVARGEEFFNPWGVTPRPKPGDIARWKLGKNPFAAEKRKAPPVQTVTAGLERFLVHEAPNRMLFNGHATFLMHLDGARVLIDPVFGSAAVVPRKSASPIPMTRVPPVDLVLLSHGHHDHMDPPSLRSIARLHPQATFVVPVGLAAVMPAQCRKVVEIDWWQTFTVTTAQGALEITFTPSQHWHRRGLNDINRALWGGWFIRGMASETTIYHSGDTAYFGGFAAIRALLGAPDIALLPAGAYEPKWFMAPQHMDPAGTLRAFAELEASTLVPMHWGTFDLSDEPLLAGIAELRETIEAPDALRLLDIGETMVLGES